MIFNPIDINSTTKFPMKNIRQTNQKFFNTKLKLQKALIQVTTNKNERS